MDKNSNRRLIRFLYVLFLISLLVLLLYFSFPLIYPFIIALLLSMFLNEIVTFVERKGKINRGLSTFFVILTFFCVSLLISYFLFRRLFVELTELLHKMPISIKNLSILLEKFETNTMQTIVHFFGKFFPIESNNKLFFTQFVTEKLKEYGTTFIEEIMVSLTNFVSSFAYMFLVIFFIMLATYFMTKDFYQLQAFWRKHSSKEVKTISYEVRRYAKQSSMALIKAHLFIALITAILSFVGLAIFRVEHLITLTLFIFIIDLIPYLGIGVLFIPWILYKFFTDQYIITVQLALLYMVIIVVRQIIEPKLLARNLGVHPLMTIIILFISLELFGAKGFFLTPLLLILISSLYHAKIIDYIFSYIRQS